MKNKERGPNSKSQGKNPNMVTNKEGKEINYVLEHSLVARNILKNQREGKPKRVKEPSLVRMKCLKIEMACAPYRVPTPSTYRKHIEPLLMHFVDHTMFAH
jgi:hypothetical protein